MTESELLTCLLLTGFKERDSIAIGRRPFFDRIGTKYFHRDNDNTIIKYWISYSSTTPIVVVTIDADGAGAGNIISIRHFHEWMVKIAKVQHERNKDN